MKLGITVFYGATNLRLDVWSTRWRNLEQCRRDDYTRRSMLENEQKKVEKAEKDKEVSTYAETGPTGSTDQYSLP